MQAQVANLEGDYIFARSKQCADVTLASSRRHCDKIADLRDRIGVLEKRNMVTSQIAQLNASIDNRRTELADTPPGQSRAYMQAVGMVAMLSWDGSQPTEVARSNLHKAINVALALALWLLPSLLAIAGYRPIPPTERFDGAPGMQSMANMSGDVSHSYTNPTGPGGGGGSHTRTETIRETQGNVPIQITHNVTHHPGTETKMRSLADARSAREPKIRTRIAQPTINRDVRALNVMRVRDTSFARRVASLTDHYETTKNARAFR